MTSAFSVMSLKRNRSTSTSKAHSGGSPEPVSKLSRLKSGLNIFSKISDAIAQHQQDSKFHSYTKRTSFIGILQYFRNDQDTKNKSRLRRKATYDSDGYYEYHHYQRKLNRQETHAQQAERNNHTMPAVQTRKLTSILIKQSDMASIKQQQKQEQPHLQYIDHPPLTKIGSRRSNATHVSASNVTINSEDLTAKEFADMAGIRILSEQDDANDNSNIKDQEKEEEQERYDADPDELVDIERKFSSGTSTDEDVHMHTVSTSKSYLDCLDEHHRLSIISYVSMQSYSTHSNKLKIWDSEFWLNPEEQHHYYYNSSRMSRSNSTATHRSAATLSSEPGAKKRLDLKPSTIAVVEPPILHELRSRNSVKKKADQNSHCVIKKGRFEIHLGDGNPTSGESSSILPAPIANDTTAISTNSSDSDQQIPNEGVLEWKRKRKD
ncbi:hypothetical protein [Parasitella parasitica]|uniref:Uncharacterized protein n=1 Tax=Parasitella parasitica TaxID=35722 RepID=A0A0B7NT35_9FUNG|nr:hypothetical protein [Parasitella parasitica]